MMMVVVVVSRGVASVAVDKNFGKMCGRQMFKRLDISRDRIFRRERRGEIRS